jgi:hypothetical protein
LNFLHHDPLVVLARRSRAVKVVPANDATTKNTVNFE